MAFSSSNLKTWLLGILLVVAGIYSFAQNMKVNSLTKEKTNLLYQSSKIEEERDSLQLAFTDMLNQKELLEKTNGTLADEIDDRDERINSLVKINASLRKTIGIREAEAERLANMNDSLLDEINSMKLSFEVDSNSVIIKYGLDYADDGFELEGDFYTVYVDSAEASHKPVGVYSKFEKISFEPKLQIVQTKTTDNIVRVYAQSLSDYMTIDSSEVFLDIDYANEVLETDNSLIKNFGFLVSGGVGKNTVTNELNLGLGGGMYKDSWSLQLKVSSSSDVGLELTKRF